MSVINALFLRFGRVVPAHQITPQLADELHSALAKVMMYAKANNVKLTSQQVRYIMEQTRQLDIYEGKGVEQVVKGPKADVIDLSKRLGPDAPYSAQNPEGWMPKEGEFKKNLDENLVKNTIDLLMSKSDPKSFQDELVKIMTRKGTYADYSEEEIKAILDSVNPEGYAAGGRIGYSTGAGKKGVQGILDLIKNKFGRKSITTADKIARPESATTRDMFKAFNERMKNKKTSYKQGDPITSENFGDTPFAPNTTDLNKARGKYGSGEDLYKILKSEGITIDKAVKEALADMPRLSGDAKYDADAVSDVVFEKLDIDPDTLDQHHVLDVYDKAYNLLTKNKKLTPKESFLKQYFAKKQKEKQEMYKDMYEKAAEDALKVLDPESEKYAKELEYDVQEQISKPGYRGGVYEAADLDDTLKIIESQKSEATKLREKYPGISEALLDKIVKDSNPQRRAEVLAALDETLTMMDKGMDKDQILGILKSTTRTKNKDGGRIGFSAGGIDKVRRALLKMFGGAAATGVAAKTGMFGLLKGNKAKEAAKIANVVKKDAPPSYIFDLAKIIRAKGKDITKQAQTIERETVKTYKGIDLYETPDGSFRIQADIPTKFSEQGRQVEIMYAKTDEVVDAGMETQKTVKGEIYEEATVSPDIDGKMKDVDMYIDDRDHAVLKEFVEEEKKKFKSGGIAYMLGE